MSSRVSAWIVIVCGLGVAALSAAGVSEQQAEAFARKMAVVNQQAVNTARGSTTPPARRTSFTESEVNSWFAYRGQDVLPMGVSQPTVTIIGGGKVSAVATVDLEVVAKRRATGRMLDPWSYVGGRVPVTLTGILHSQDGMGRFELEEAAISGVPVPASLVQDMVSYYSRTAKTPAGVRLDDSFPLPARIRQIEVGQGQAVVVQ